jgi:hypothetical protein
MYIHGCYLVLWELHVEFIEHKLHHSEFPFALEFKEFFLFLLRNY